VRTTKLVAFVAVLLPMGALLGTSALADVQIADITDTLDNAVKGPRLINGSTDPYFDIYGAFRAQFDNNIFRLPSGADVQQVVGPSASREDHVNSPSAGLDGQWALGRQIFSVQAQVADNRYSQNTNLNNVSTIDKATWNWGVASVLSGQVGADFTRSLLSFVNAQIYERNTYTHSRPDFRLLIRSRTTRLQSAGACLQRRIGVHQREVHVSVNSSSSRRRH